ncbi:DUF4181 domain-containing protein [Psychrobacillus sp. NPDC093180]|uniref:DUF4181 domain-containing protein n=1 Tax=Psychrobacillus sp. NPDC093180 TaxID=3364489 RepID=UPI0037FAD8A5
MQWVAIILIYILLIISSLMLERFIKKKFHLPKKYKANKSYTNNQTYLEVILVIIAVIGCVLASISRYENGDYHPLNPIPMYLWLSLYLLVLFGFRGLLARRYAKESNEHYYHFTFAVWMPILLVLAFLTTNHLLV